MAIQHVPRYVEIGRLLLKHARADVDPTADPDDVPPEAEELADDLEKMGPTFIKLGQLLSTRADLLPPQYTVALSRLQDDIEAMRPDVVEDVFADEIGMTVMDAFEWFDPEPLASASLGQVHRARLANGHEVVVKVQRPEAKQRIRDDLDAIEGLGSWMDAHTRAGKRMGFGELIEQFRQSLEAELDYKREAANLGRLREIVEPYNRLLVPRPVKELTTTRVLTMDYVPGRKVTEITDVGRTDVDGPELCDQLFRAYLDQILVAGFFHADPHPGNITLTDIGQLGLLDLGMVARVEPRMQDALARLLVAVSEGRGEEAGRVTISISTPLDDFDEEAFVRGSAALVAKSEGADMGDVAVGTLVMEISRLAYETGLRQPPELSLLGKALLNLDQIAARLDPHFDPTSAIRDHADSVMQERLKPSRERMYATALDAREFLEELPGRLNRLLDSASKGELQMKVEAIDEKELLRGMRQIANRVTMGLVLAALVVAAAMLMQVETSSTLFGYPTIAIVCFLVAFLGALALLVAIIREGRRQQRA